DVHPCHAHSIHTIGLALPPAPARVPAPYTCPRAPCLAHQARSERYTATLSGVVSAGSNPAGGAGQRYKFEHFDNLARAGARAPTCGDAQAFRAVCPIRTWKAGTGDERACSAAFGDNGRQAVALTAGRCPDRRPLP